MRFSIFPPRKLICLLERLFAHSRNLFCILHYMSFNPIALRKAKIVCNFGLSECNRVKMDWGGCGMGVALVPREKVSLSGLTQYMYLLIYDMFK